MTPEFFTKTSQEIPQDDVFLQAKVDLQEVLKLGANLEVKWSKIKQDEVKLSSLLFPLLFGRPREEERECLVGMNLSLEDWREKVQKGVQGQL